MLIQIATSVCQALSNPTVVDAIQPMQTGWSIYLHTQVDRQTLVNKGLTVAGKYVALCSEYKSASRNSVKITLRDLTLHDVGNEDMLKALWDLYTVLSTINYSNIWHNGQLTNIHNSDRFVYIDAIDLPKIPDMIDVGEYRAYVVCPKAISVCKCCHKEGHYASDDSCPEKAPQEIQNGVEAFRGGKFPLSNLHKCPHSYKLKDQDSLEYVSSEHHYQNAKLKAHDKADLAESLFSEENPFKVMQTVQHALPKDELLPVWRDKDAKAAMSYTNALKFRSCTHAMEALLESHPLIAEATGDRFWGTGLHLDATHEYLSEFWPGKNIMGDILMQLLAAF